MGQVPDWQRQNMKKTGASGPTTTSSRKDLGSLFHSAPAAQHKSVTKPMHLADGDTEETYKARGLEASSGENVGFFERMRMGNIDQPGSEAYNRFGAGRGREVEAEITRLANRSAAASAPREAEPASSSSSDDTPNYGRDSVREGPVGSEDTPSRPVVRRGATSSVSGSSSRSGNSGVSTSESGMRNYTPRRPAQTEDESSAETSRLRRQSVAAIPDQSEAETSRLKRQNSAARGYETPFDRMNRENREAAAARASARESERAILRENVRNRTSGDIDPKTLLPKR